MQTTTFLRLTNSHRKDQFTVNTDGKDCVKGDIIFYNELLSLNVL